MFLVLLSSALALDEMHTYAVEAFGPDPECCSSCGLIPWSIDASNAVDNVFDDFIADSDWDTSRTYSNEAVDPQDWTDADEDPDFGNDADDPWGADAADVAFLFTHGSSDCSSDGVGDELSVVMGAYNGDGTYADACSPDSNGEWRFGDDQEDLEIVVMNACHTADTCAVENGAFAFSTGTDLHGDDLRLYLGFHGISYSSPGSAGEVQAFASTSLNNGVGTHWLTERVYFGILGNDDQCPVAIAWGTDGADALGFINNGGFGDRTNNTPHEVRRRMWIDGCDPDEGGAM